MHRGAVGAVLSGAFRRHWRGTSNIEHPTLNIEGKREGYLLVEPIVEMLSKDEMNSLVTVFIALFVVTSAWAFEPAGPPPKKTFEWTVNHLTNATFPAVAMDKDTILTNCIDFMNLSRPAECSVQIDASAINKEKLRASIQIEIYANNIKVIDFLAKIAEVAQANIVIETGKVRLIPGNTAPKPGAIESAKKPAQTASPKVPAKPKP